MEKLFNSSTKKIQDTNLEFKRFIIHKLKRDRRLIGIKGARGSGKTTLLLQYIKEHFGTSDEVLYVSLDNIYFSKYKLLNLANKFANLGGKYLFLDEVHKYPNWSKELKNIYDDYPELKVFFTGSSILEIDKSEADLSRRAIIYDLPVLSLREFIALKYGIEIKAFSLPEILNNHKEIAGEINKAIKPVKAFNEYNKHGAYPFSKEAQEDYPIHLERIVNLMLETDLPVFKDIDYSSVMNLKKLLLAISESVPFKPNISKLSINTGVTRDTLIKYLSYLEKAQLILLLRNNTSGISRMAKPDKIYLNNANLLYALSPTSVNPGTIRETFFYNQVSAIHKVALPKSADFIVDNKYTFEIGEKNKAKKQIAGIKNAYIVSDNIEYGFKNRIPLWMFGFLY
jgi:uncharacterized protein